MINKLEDMKADILPVADRGENVGHMEPLRISESSRHRGKLTDLAIKLAGKAARLRNNLAPGFRTAFADIVRAMMPRITKQGVASEEEIDIETLGQRLIVERIAANSLYVSDMAFGAWARKP